MELLKKLTSTAGVPGREGRVRDLIREEVEGHFDEIRVDNMGSLICVRRPRPKDPATAAANPTKVMLAAHMDQIGFLVRFIDSNGMIRVNAVGGFDTRNLFARRVTVCTGSGDLPGVMNPAGKPIHVSTPEERKKIPEMHEFFIDLGMAADDVKEKVRIGDMVILDEPPIEVGETMVAQALDNRIGCWAGVRSIQQLEHHDCEIYCVFTVQEEVGLRGAGPATFGIQPDIGIALDTTLACDTPGVTDEFHLNKMGDGVAIKVMDGSMISDIDVVRDIEAAAKAEEIPHQISMLHRGGTDSGAMQRTAYGTRVATIACPVRYIHTVTEMSNKKDIESMRDIITAWLARVK